MFKEDFEIPAKVRITARTTYRIVWIKEFADPTQLGEADYTSKTITLKTDMSKRKTFFVFLHELFHVVSYHKGLSLVEREVEGLETGIDRVAKLNNWI